MRIDWSFIQLSLSLRQSAHIFLSICHCVHNTLSPQPERVIRWIAPKMKDLDLNFNNMPEYLKKIQGIPEENLWKVEEFRKNQLFRANVALFKF